MMGFFAGIWGKIAAIGAIVFALLAAIGMIRKGGADSERAKAGAAALRRTTEANAARVEASKPITPKEEANDSFNRDR